MLQVLISSLDYRDELGEWSCNDLMPRIPSLLKSQLFTKWIVFRWTTLKMLLCPPWLFYSFVVGEFKACHTVTPSSLRRQHNSRAQMCLR